MIKVNPYPYLFALVAVVALYAGHRVIVSMEVADAVVSTTLRLEKGYQDSLLAAAVDARKTETKLELSALALEKVKDDEIKRINGKLSVALNSLSKRQSRPTTTNGAKTITTIQACTGAQLYKEDGEFLVREANRADEVAIERDYWYNQYENARKTLNEYSNSH